MHGRVNEVKTDLLEYGSKLIDNSISDDELEAFFTKYNGRDSPTLDIIMKNCFRYLETAQIFQLCKRLIPLEAKYNYRNNGMFRNKTPATICLNEFMSRVGHNKKIYNTFTKYNNLEDFVNTKIDMNFELGCLYSLLSDQPALQIVHAKRIGRIYAFHAICTPVNEIAAQTAEQDELLSTAVKARSLLSSKEKHIKSYFIKIFNEISWHPSNHEMKIIKSNEEIQHDKERFIQEMSCLSDCNTHSFTTWPMSFVKTMKTPAEEDLIQRTIFFNTLKNIKLEMYGPQKKIKMMLDKLVSMLNATLENHQQWINHEVLVLARDIFLKAAKYPVMANNLQECETILQELKNSISCTQRIQVKSSHL